MFRLAVRFLLQTSAMNHDDSVAVITLISRLFFNMSLAIFFTTESISSVRRFATNWRMRIDVPQKNELVQIQKPHIFDKLR